MLWYQKTVADVSPLHKMPVDRKHIALVHVWSRSTQYVKSTASRSEGCIQRKREFPDYKQVLRYSQHQSLSLAFEYLAVHLGTHIELRL